MRRTQERDTPVYYARKLKGLSQAEAARRAGIAQTHWGQIERGGSRPTIDVAYRIAAALECELRQLWPPSVDAA